VRLLISEDWSTSISNRFGGWQSERLLLCIRRCLRPSLVHYFGRVSAEKKLAHGDKAYHVIATGPPRQCPYEAPQIRPPFYSQLNGRSSLSLTTREPFLLLRHFQIVELVHAAAVNKALAPPRSLALIGSPKVCRCWLAICKVDACRSAR
jgi:hypothetical protein